MNKGNQTSRVQTTVSIATDAVDGLGELSRESGVSRSRLVDLAIRQFLRWAAQVSARDLRLIADYEVSETTVAFTRRRSTTLPPPMPEYEETVVIPAAPAVPVIRRRGR